MTKAEHNAKLVFDYISEHDGLARAIDMNEVLGLKRQSINNALSYLYKNGVITKEPTRRKSGQVWLLVDRSKWIVPCDEEMSSESLISRSLEQFTEQHNEKEVNQEDIEWMRKYRKRWVMKYTMRGLIPPKL